MSSPEPELLLVADDSSANRELLERHLLRQGYAVECVEDGEAALAAVKRGNVALALLDIHMPAMDGIQVLEEMRKDPHCAETPVIVISADRELDTIARCIQLGAEDYLPKPFNSTVLRARVSRSLEKRRARSREQESLARLVEEKENVEHLLYSLFPRFAIEELKSTNQIRPMRFNQVAILFADIVNYTRYSENHRPEEVWEDLQQLFLSFERITDAHMIEKISAMGDEYMAVGGLGRASPDAVLRCVEAGQQMIEAARMLPTHFDIRIGVNVGNVVGGVVGQRKFHYSVWGDAVNVAARMQSHGLVGAVNLSRMAWECLEGRLPGASRGFVDVKGKGPMEMFVVGS